MQKHRKAHVFTAQAAISLVAFAVSFWAAPLGHAQSSLPQLGDEGLMSVAAERKLGQRIAREIYRDPDYLDDPVLGDYVQRIWQPLMQAARQRGDLTPELQDRFAWQVMLARDRSVNAFALPGGYLGVHLGLIALVANRDELASVLSHEMIHVTQRHIARITSKQNQQAPWLLGAMILGALAARQNSDVAGAVISGSQAINAQAQLNFSRDMEREADRIGFQIMQDAQFNMQGFAGMFDKLAVANRINDNGSYPYLRSHPLTSERIGDMQARMPLGAQAAPAPSADVAIEHAMMARRARILASPTVDLLRGEMAQAQIDLAKWTSRTASAPAQPLLAAGLYAGALAALKQRDFANAQKLLDSARESLPSHSLGIPPHGPASAPSRSQLLGGTQYAAQAVAVLQAEIALAQGVQAIAAREKALAQLRPLAMGSTPERAVLLHWAQLVSQNGGTHADLAAASETLQAWLVDKPQDALAWDALATIFTAQKHTLRAIRAQGEARVAVLDYSAALDRFKAGQAAARSSANADYIELSIIDARTRAVQALQREFVSDKPLN